MLWMLGLFILWPFFVVTPPYTVLAYLRPVDEGLGSEPSSSLRVGRAVRAFFRGLLMSLASMVFAWLFVVVGGLLLAGIAARVIDPPEQVERVALVAFMVLIMALTAYGWIASLVKGNAFDLFSDAEEWALDIREHKHDQERLRAQRQDQAKDLDPDDLT